MSGGYTWHKAKNKAGDRRSNNSIYLCKRLLLDAHRLAAALTDENMWALCEPIMLSP